MPCPALLLHPLHAMRMRSVPLHGMHPPLARTYPHCAAPLVVIHFLHCHRRGRAVAAASRRVQQTHPGGDFLRQRGPRAGRCVSAHRHAGRHHGGCHGCQPAVPFPGCLLSRYGGGHGERARPWACGRRRMWTEHRSANEATMRLNLLHVREELGAVRCAAADPASAKRRWSPPRWVCDGVRAVLLTSALRNKI